MSGERRGTRLDLALVAGLGLAVLGLLLVVDLSSLIDGGPPQRFTLGLVEALVIVVFLVLGFTYYALRRWQELRDEAHRRGRAEAILDEASGLVSSLVAAQRAMGSSEQGLDEFLRVAAEHAQRLGRGDGAAVETLKGDMLTCRVATGSMEGVVGRRHKIESTPFAAAVASGEAALLDAAAHVAPGVEAGSTIVLPLRVEGHTMGVLVVLHATPGGLGRSELHALRPVGKFVAHTMWNAADFKSKESLVKDYNKAMAASRETQQWLENIAVNIREVFWVTDPAKKKVIYVNPAFEAVFGRGSDDLYNVPGTWFEAIVDEDRDRVRKLVLEKGPKGEFEETYRIRRPDGAVRWIHETAMPIYNAAGEVSMVAAVAEDLTEGIEARSELQATRRRLEFPYEAGPVVAYAAAPSGDYGLKYVSPNAEQVLGYLPGDITADPNFWTVRLHPDEQPRVFAELAKLFEHGTHRQEYRFRHGDGEWRTLMDTMRLVRDANGDPQEIVGFWLDVSDRKRAEEGLAYSLNRIKELQDSRTQILNTIAHDLGSPLSPIFLQLTILDRTATNLDEKARNSLKIIERNAKQVNMLVQDLKDLARLEAGKLKMQLEPIELGKLVGEAVDSFTEPYKERGIHLEYSAEGSLVVKADAQRVNQVLFNFLTNAMKFTPKDGKVVVSAARQEGLVRVSVQDSGRGLTSEEIDRLFKPFSQVHDPKEIKERGTGLGLFICKGVIEAHGGKVGVSSRGHGKGSTFHFAIPLAK